LLFHAVSHLDEKSSVAVALLQTSKSLDQDRIRVIQEMADEMDSKQPG
jgi:hypothetical protein